MFPGNLHDKDFRRLDRLLESSERAREKARKYLEFNAPPSKKGVVGEVQDCIFDSWTGMVIGVAYWDPVSIKTDFRRRNNKHWNNIARFGCWGHPGKLVGIYRVSAYLFLLFSCRSWNVESWPIFTSTIWVVPLLKTSIHSHFQNSWRS
jgi:hypothetical protein